MLFLCVLLCSVVGSQATMEGFIVGGSLASINRYPYSAFLAVSCITERGKAINWICGSSILNQKLLLTAAHCMYSCGAGTKISVNMGNEHRQAGIARSASGFLIHERYINAGTLNDIGLVKMSIPIQLSSRVSRVAILKRPPYSEHANIAGWGQTNEQTKAQALKLKEVDQKVWRHADCERLFGELPKGTICASSNKKNGFAAAGDSGSGLVVRGYIQIGLVSFKKPAIAVDIVVYSDVGYFYDWIIYNSHRLYCFTRL